MTQSGSIIAQSKEPDLWWSLTCVQGGSTSAGAGLYFSLPCNTLAWRHSAGVVTWNLPTHVSSSI